MIDRPKVNREVGEIWTSAKKPESEPSLFRVALRSEPWPTGIKHARRLCVVCGQYWIPWAGSRLRCHGRCLFSDHGHQWIASWFADHPTGSLVELAGQLGVSIDIVRAALHAQGVNVR